MVFVLVGKEEWSIKEAIKACLPVSFEKWWFASTYFYLLMVAPFVSLVLKKLSQKLYFDLLILFSFLWVIIPTFSTRNLFIFGNNLTWFIYLYALAGYVRLYAPKTLVSGKTYLLLAAGMYFLITLSVIVFDYMGLKWSICADHATYFAGMQKLTVVVVSVCLLLGFMKLMIKQNKWINIISSTTFGIYLVHDSDQVRKYLWENLFRNSSFAESGWLVPYSLFAILLVFIICGLIEFVRKNTIERVYSKWVNVLSAKVKEWFEPFYRSEAK